MNRPSKTSLTPAARRGHSLVLGQARCLMAVAVVFVAVVSLCFIGRQAGAASGDKTSKMNDRVGIRVSGVMGTGASAQDAGSFVPGCVAPPGAMIAWFPGDGNAQDILNNTQDLSINGGVTFPAGKVAQAFEFDGTGSVIYSNISAGNAYTIDFWVKTTRTGTTEALLGHNIASNNFGTIRIQSGQVQYLQGNVVRVAGGSIPVNTYTHVALTYDSAFNRLYINGDLVATSAAHTEVFNNQISLGSATFDTSGSAGSAFIGQLDEVEIFNRQLSESEIESIFNADSAGKCKTPVDADGDGIVNSRDACPNTPSGTTVNAAGCPVGACFPPPGAMISWFPGDGSAQDILNNTNVDDVEGGVTFPAGKVAQTFEFDGTGFVKYSNIGAGNAYTVDFWVKTTRTGVFETLVANNINSQNFGVIRVLNGQIQYLQNNVVRVAGGSIPVNTYAHVALTYDSAFSRLYINGDLVATSAAHTEVFNNQISLGTGVFDTSGSAGSAFIGQLDEVEIFNRQLSQTEIRGIFNANSVGKCKTTVVVVDTDDDGVVDNLDACPNTPPGTTVNAAGCPAGACFAPPGNMMNWFPGDGNANDIQGSNNGVPTTGVTFPAGKVAQAFGFNGTGSVSYTTINAGNDYTIDFWVKTTRTGVIETLVANNINSNNFGTIRVLNGQIQYLQGNVLRLQSSNSFPVNTYTHVALTYDSAFNRLYINGDLVATSVQHTEVFNNQISLGAGVFDTSGSAGSAFLGELDEVEIFDRQLSQAEIRGIFYADSVGKCKPINCQPVTLSPSSLPNGAVGTPYNQTISASGAPGPFTYSVTSGALPPGLGLNSSTGQLSGTPTAVGLYNFTVTASNAGGCSGSRSYALTIDAAPPPPPPPTDCVQPPAGMVAWLPGDGNAADISGNGNHGTLHNGATFAPGKVAQAFSLDGVDDYVLVNHSPSLSSAAAVTIDLWAYPTSYGPNYNRFVEKGGASAVDPGGYSLEFNACANGQPTCASGTQGVSFVIWSDTVGPFVVLHSNAPIPLNTWTHIAGVFDGSTMSLYINGVLQGTAQASMGSTTDNLAIGRLPNIADNHHFNGQIDEVEIFNRALSQEEIQSIVAADSFGKCKPNAARRTPFDFDGDGKTDVSSWNPTVHSWLIQNSTDFLYRFVPDWGSGALGDVAVPRDYDGDGKTDIAVWRPSEGNWYIIRSTGGGIIVNWGLSTDKPVPADYDGDGKTDVAVWRPTEGNWYIIKSSGGGTVQGWGISTDIPVPADYDGDGRADIAIYRPSEGNWYIIDSLSNNARLIGWGTGNDQPVPADFDGDGRTDVAVFRPSEGNWYIRYSSGGATVKGWGLSTDKLVPGDYDGDGKADIAIYRPSEGNWYIIQSSTNTGRLEHLGQGADDVPAPSTYIPQ